MYMYKDIDGRRISVPEKLLVLNNRFNRKSSESAVKGYTVICTGYMDCSTCVMQLKEIELFKTKYPEFNYVYIAAGKEHIYFLNQIKKSNFSFPVLKDSNSTFITENALEKYNQDVFLVNSNNEIVFIGNPFQSEFIESFFKYFYNE